MGDHVTLSASSVRPPPVSLNLLLYKNNIDLTKEMKEHIESSRFSSWYLEENVSFFSWFGMIGHSFPLKVLQCRKHSLGLLPMGREGEVLHFGNSLSCVLEKMQN